MHPWGGKLDDDSTYSDIGVCHALLSFPTYCISLTSHTLIPHSISFVRTVAVGSNTRNTVVYSNSLPLTLDNVQSVYVVISCKQLFFLQELYIPLVRLYPSGYLFFPELFKYIYYKTIFGSSINTVGTKICTSRFCSVNIWYYDLHWEG